MPAVLHDIPQRKFFRRRRVGVEAPDDIQLVPSHGEPARQEGAAEAPASRHYRQGREGIGRRVVTENPRRVSYDRSAPPPTQ